MHIQESKETVYHREAPPGLGRAMEGGCLISSSAIRVSELMKGCKF